MKRILVLDDNNDILNVTTEVLAYEQFEVRGIQRSIEFFPVAESFSPDLVILDLRLADGHGGELCRQIKKHPRHNKVPVIIFTAYQRLSENLRDYGCDAIINKPFDIDELLKKVNEVMKNPN